MIDFNALKTTIHDGVLDALQKHSSHVTAIPRTAQGDIPINGLPLELYPWHRYLAMSLRGNLEIANRYSQADWEHFEFASSNRSESSRFRAAAALVTQVYDAAKDDPNGRQEAAHLIFLAAAEALLGTGLRRFPPSHGTKSAGHYRQI